MFDGMDAGRGVSMPIGRGRGDGWGELPYVGDLVAGVRRRFVGCGAADGDKAVVTIVAV